MNERYGVVEHVIASGNFVLPSRFKILYAIISVGGPANIACEDSIPDENCKAFLLGERVSRPLISFDRTEIHHIFNQRSSRRGETAVQKNLRRERHS